MSLVRGGGSGGGASIAEDMYFSTIAERDTFTSNNPERIKQGVTCAVTSTPNYDYYQWDDSASTWRDANLIFQGKNGEPGQEGAPGTDGNPNEGFILDAGASIGMTDSVGNADTIISYDNDDCVLGDTSNEKRTVIKSNDKLYVNITNGQGNNETLKVLDDSDRVNIDGFQTPNIQTGNGLDTVDNSDGSVTIEVTGKQDVVDIDVSGDSTVTLDNSFVGKFVNITQSGQAVPLPMQITIASHDLFNEGDVIKVAADQTYVNYYIAIYYSDKTGRQYAIYPAKSATLTATKNSWDVNQDGTFTKVAVRPKADAGTIFADDDPDVRPVQAFSFIDHPAVNYIEDEDGNRAVEIDLNKIINVSPDTVDIVGWWSDNASPDAGDITNALGQVQSATLISHTDNVKSDELPETNIAMRREEAGPKYTYFAYPSGFFTDKDGAQLEPTLVNTGVGNSSDWVVSTVNVDGVTYRIQRSPAQNVSQQLLTCKLIQEGY